VPLTVGHAGPRPVDGTTEGWSAKARSGELGK
jgi:hypothetical protein